MDRVVSRLRSSHLLGSLSPEWLTKISTLCSLVKYSEGDHLWWQEERGKHFTIIQSGLIQIQKTKPNGEINILNLFGPHESIGDIAILQDKQYPADAVVASPEALILQIDATPLLAAMNTDLAFSHAIQSALMSHTSLLRSKIEILSAGSVNARLASLFLYLAERFGNKEDNSTKTIPIILSRAALASLISARVETVIRSLRTFKDSSCVITTKEGFIVHLPALQRVLDED